MKKGLIFLFITVLATAAFRSVDALFTVPKDWPQPVYNFKANPLTPAKIALGRKLFFDPILSGDNTISCASCHLPQTAFTHVDHDLSHGISGKTGTRNSPALVNLAWQQSFMWDGAVHHLDVQALAPISNASEMGGNITTLIPKLQRSGRYSQLFQAAWGDSVITGEHLLKSLSQFMLTFVSANSKYDKVQRGEDTFNTYQAHGYQLFKANCASCHKEPLFTNGQYANNGLPPDTTLNDEGRMKVTGKAADRGRFKVPTLRNIEVSYPYMHDGRFKSLQMVLFHYTNGIAQSPTLAPQLKAGIHLSETEKRDLIAFLKTLTDEAFLHNAAYQPERL